MNYENNEESTIDNPNDLLIKVESDHISSIANNICSNLLDNLNNSSYFQDRVILAPTLKDVDSVNEYMLYLIHRDEKVYLSSDSICKADVDVVDRIDNLYALEFFNSVRLFGFPNHHLKLKVGALVMLLKNIDKSMGLCNGTGVIVSRLGKNMSLRQL